MEEEAQEKEPHLLVDWKADNTRPPLSITAIGSILIHVLIFGLIMVAPALPGPSRMPFEHGVVDVSKATPIFLPPELLTQKVPNKREVSKDLDLAGLVAKPDLKSVPSTSALPAPLRKFEPPPAPSPKNEPAKTIDTAKLEPAPTLPQQQTPPAIGTAQQAFPVSVPPPPPPVEKPKLAFETPGSQMGVQAGRGGLLEGTHTSIEEAAKKAMRSGGSASVNESDLQMPGMGSPGAQSKGSSSLELLSDPLGVDFRPYLVRVLAVIRRNWFLVLPEGARMGQRGRTVVQFSIAKNGAVPKLVIHSPSGNEPLDRAAVAGISMSNPLPPLPNEYRGDVLRLQLVFSYNMPGAGVR